MKALTSLSILAGLIVTGALFAQSPGEETPTGVAGGFGGTVEVGSGSFDPYELNATRSITDVVVPGAVLPFTYTRIWNSRGGWRDNWSWAIKNDEDTESGGGGANNLFHGYIISYPDGRKVSFNKPVTHPASGPGDPGTYTPTAGVEDSFVIDASRTAAHLYLADGSVVNWTESCNQYGTCSLALVSVDDPYKRRVTISVDPYVNGTTITEPGGRWIHLSVGQISGKTVTSTLTTSLGQSVTYSTTYNASGYYSASPGPPDPNGPAYGPNIITTESSVIYNDVIDPATGQPAQAHYTYKNVQPLRTTQPPTSPPPPAFDRLVWANDPFFRGPLKQVRYIYVDNPGDSTYDATMTQVYEERYSTSLSSAGVMVNRFQQQPWTWSIDQGGYSEGYFTRVQTRGDGVKRTLSYWNPTAPHNYYDSHNQLHHDTGYGQNLIDHFTDWTNNSNVTERHEYDFTHYFTTPIKITDMNGNVMTQQLENVLGKVKKQTYVAEGTFKSWTYTDPANPYYVASVTNERGKVTGFIRDPAIHQITQINHPDGGVEKFWYNSFRQVTKHQRVNGNYDHFLYDGRGLMTAQYNPMANALPVPTDPRTLFTYYPTSSVWGDRLQKKTLPANAQGLIASETYEYERDSSNAPYRGRGLVSKITHADGTYRSFAYNLYGWKWWEADELGNLHWNGFDLYGRVISDHNSYGATGYTYNPSNGSSTSPYVVTSNTPDSITGPTGYLQKFDYDQNLRKITAVEAWGTAQQGITRFAYDANGNVTLLTDPLNHYTSTTYDSRNRKKTVTEAYGTSLARTTTYTYGDGINVTQIDKPDGTSVTKTYDPMDRLYTDTVPRASATDTMTTTIFYNDSGTVSQVTDGNSHWTKFFYDESDRKTQMYYYNAQTENWSYDDAGNVATRTTVGGEIQTFSYDNRNRKVQMTWSNNAEWCTYGYDDASNLISAKNGTGALNTHLISTVTRNYDAANRMILDEQNVNGLGVKDVNYEYDAEGKQTRLYSDYDNYDYTFSYDARNRFEKIKTTGAGSPSFQYYYDGASNETKRSNLINGVDQSYTPYDALNRMTRRDIIDGNGTNLNAEGYTYDPMSRITRVDRSANDDSVYTYYQDGELKSGTYVAPELNPVSYVWDKAGNRTSITDGGVNKTYSPNGINQYTAAEGSGVTNGNDHEITGYQGVTYDYLNDGQLNSATIANTTYTMAYDALGRCVKRTLNGAATYHVYDGEKPILEYKGNGTLNGWNIYGKGIDEILMRGYLSGSTWVWYYYQQDHEGSVTHLTDGYGAVIERYKYDAFGEPIIYNAAGTVITNSAYNNRFLFTGREWAPKNLGFYEYRARAYHPGLGRFMSEDPKGFDAGDYNLYRYCDNDPEDGTDPMGLFSMPPEQSISGGVVDIDNAPGLHSGTTGSSIVTSSGLEAQWKASHGGSSSGAHVAQVWSEGTQQRLVLGGNATKPINDSSHYTDEKLKANGTPAAGVTTAELISNQNGTVTVKVDARVRRNLAAKDPTLLPREWQHVERWKSWIARMNRTSSDFSKAFGQAPWNRETSDAARVFLGPYYRNEIIRQRLDYDLKNGPHDIDYGLKE